MTNYEMAETLNWSDEESLKKLFLMKAFFLSKKSLSDVLINPS